MTFEPSFSLNSGPATDQIFLAHGAVGKALLISPTMSWREFCAVTTFKNQTYISEIVE
jgi:hypothetical protein